MSDQTIHLIRPDPVTEGKRTVQGTKLIPQHISTGTLHSSDDTVRCCLGDSDGHHVNELSPLWVAAYIYTTKKTWPPVLSPHPRLQMVGVSRVVQIPMLQPYLNFEDLLRRNTQFLNNILCYKCVLLLSIIHLN